jgi:hypothetical protein
LLFVAIALGLVSAAVAAYAYLQTTAG